MEIITALMTLFGVRPGYFAGYVGLYFDPHAIIPSAIHS